MLVLPTISVRRDVPGFLGYSQVLPSLWNSAALSNSFPLQLHMSTQLLYRFQCVAKIQWQYCNNCSCGWIINNSYILTPWSLDNRIKWKKESMLAPSQYCKSKDLKVLINKHVNECGLEKNRQLIYNSHNCSWDNQVVVWDISYNHSILTYSICPNFVEKMQVELLLLVTQLTVSLCKWK